MDEINFEKYSYNKLAVSAAIVQSNMSNIFHSGMFSDALENCR